MRNCCLYLIAGLALLSLNLSAKVTEVPLDALHPTEKLKLTTQVIIEVMNKHHYKRPELNDGLSADILDRYLMSLDPNKSFFSKKDLQAFEQYRHTLDDALNDGDMLPAFFIFKRFREKVSSRVETALMILRHYPFNFRRAEIYRFNREDQEWQSETELDDTWRRRVKNDILALKLADKDDTEIHKTLDNRYGGILRRARQFTSDDIFQTFINAYTLSVEPHTSYMSPRTSENFDISMRLSLQGIGAVLRSENEYTLVQRVVPGGPADRSRSMGPGDRIVGVAQGKTGEMLDVIGWRLQDVVDQIRGNKGTIVRLGILPKSAATNGRTKEVVIERDNIKLEDQAAKSEIIEQLDGLQGMKIGVIDIPAFYRDFKAQAAGEKDFRSTTRDVRQLLKDLEAKRVDGIVIDLRGNGGGSLAEATELTGLFIQQGPVVQVKDASGKVNVEHDDDAEQAYRGPLAVLVNRYSASASEIFAGAIQDYQRGIILGEPTFGKGTVQTLVTLNRFLHGDGNHGRLRLTMAQFFRVNGGSTQHRGVTPDIVFPTASISEDQGERSLDNALPWDRISPLNHKIEGKEIDYNLRDLHLHRAENDAGFLFLVRQEAELTKLREQHTVSLVEQLRRVELDQREQGHLARRNQYRKTLGLDPITDVSDDEDLLTSDDDPEVKAIQHIQLNESARILSDQIRLLSRRAAERVVYQPESP